VDEQEAGKYRLRESDPKTYFDCVAGPTSWKACFFPPCETVLEARQQETGWTIATPQEPVEPLALVGIRACDLQALRVLDRVMLEGPYVDAGYAKRRESLFVVGVNCRRAAPTCFCHSTKSGPALAPGFDLGLTELRDFFVVEIGTERGGDVILAARWTPCSLDDIHTARNLPTKLAEQMQRRGKSATQFVPDQPAGRHLDMHELSRFLLDNLEHPRWEEVARRCLACGNCTLVCPTCFCSSVDEVSDLTGTHTRRERSWSSCFNHEHSYMNSGTVRRTVSARYRQWLVHKLATWQEQFGVGGCVGCGRCIVWCPVGIDLTAEVAAMRGGAT
jgi:ferredoxin